MMLFPSEINKMIFGCRRSKLLGLEINDNDYYESLKDYPIGRTEVENLIDKYSEPIMLLKSYNLCMAGGILIVKYCYTNMII